MGVLHRNRDVRADPAAAASQQDRAGQLATPPSGRLPRTRTGASWLGVCTAAVAFEVLIIFMPQNKHAAEQAGRRHQQAAPIQPRPTLRAHHTPTAAQPQPVASFPGIG